MIIKIFEKVAIFDQESGEVLFADSNPMNLTVNEAERITEFQVEDGSTRSDHVVTLPIEIAIELHLREKLSDEFAKFQEYKKDHKFITVQARTCSYSNMIIEDISHEETVENFGGASLTLRLKEFREVTPETGAMPQEKVAKSRDADTSKRGEIKGTEVPAQSGGESAWYQLYQGGKKGINNFFGGGN